MNVSQRFLHRFGRAFLLAIGLSVGLGACSDDPSGPSTPPGSSTVTFLHANPAYTSDVIVKREGATLINSLLYGSVTTALVDNSNATFRFAATDGTELTSAQAQPDSTRSTWVIFSGSANKREAFAVLTKKIALSATNAAVRVIHASETAPPIKVLVNDSTGLSLTTGAIPYKSGSDFTTVPAATTTQLYIMNNNTNLSLLATPVTLEAGKQYTVVVYGSASVQGQYGLAVKVVLDAQ